MNHLIEVEEKVIDLTEKVISQAQNATLKYLLRAIQHDSRKHADWGRAALEVLEYGKIVGVEERKEVWDLLKKHADMERNHKDFLSEMKKLTDTPALKYIFEQIWNDEKIHHAMLETMMTKRFEKDPAKYWGALLGS